MNKDFYNDFKEIYEMKDVIRDKLSNIKNKYDTFFTKYNNSITDDTLKDILFNIKKDMDDLQSTYEMQTISYMERAKRIIRRLYTSVPLTSQGGNKKKTEKKTNKKKTN